LFGDHQKWSKENVAANSPEGGGVKTIIASGTKGKGSGISKPGGQSSEPRQGEEAFSNNALPRKTGALKRKTFSVKTRHKGGGKRVGKNGFWNRNSELNQERTRVKGEKKKGGSR